MKRYLTIRNALITAGLVTIYVAILRWDEHHIEPPVTMFTMLPAFCPESIPIPVGFLPLATMLLVGGWAWLIGLGTWRLGQTLARIFRRGGK